MPERAPTRRTYHYPLRARASHAGAVLAAVALAAFAAWLQLRPDIDLFERGQLLVFTAVFGALAAHAAGALRTMRPVTLLAEGIETRAGLVAWSRIARVDIQPLLRRMDVFDDTERRVLTLHRQLEAFRAVQDYILEHATPRPCALPCRVPLLTPFTGAPLVAGLALIALWFGPRQSGAPALLAALGAALLVVLHWSRRREMALLADRIVLRQGWRRFEVAYREITAVQVRVRPDGRGAARVLRLERGGQEAIEIAGFRGGYRHAFESVGRAWAEAKQRA